MQDCVARRRLFQALKIQKISTIPMWMVEKISFLLNVKLSELQLAIGSWLLVRDMSA